MKRKSSPSSAVTNALRVGLTAPHGGAEPLGHPPIISERSGTARVDAPVLTKYWKSGFGQSTLLPPPDPQLAPLAKLAAGKKVSKFAFSLTYVDCSDPATEDVCRFVPPTPVTSGSLAHA